MKSLGKSGMKRVISHKKMENNLDNAKKYLVETNFEFFTQSEQNVIGKTMVAYFNFLKSQEEKKDKWIEIKSNPPKSPKGFRCESFDNKIVFVDHMGRIGFCPTQLTNSVQINKVPTIYTSKEEINSYCENTYGNKYNNKICQFNCGTLSKLKKERAGLSNVYTK